MAIHANIALLMQKMRPQNVSEFACFNLKKHCLNHKIFTSSQLNVSNYVYGIDKTMCCILLPTMQE